MGCPFPVDSIVTWARDTPDTWHYTITPGPMKVVSARGDEGKPSEYSLRFCEGGIPRTPGWIITIEFDGDKTTYYDPPLSIFFGKWIKKEIHEKWLTLLDQT